MSPDAIIEFKGVSKQYRRGGGLLSVLFRGGAGTTDEGSNFWALRHLSFAVPRGEVLGIIGPNGAGKSTILKLLAGVTVPDAGTLRISGRIAPLIELGAGFHPELSGRENVFLNGALLGLTRREIDARYEEIVEFAELADFMDSPVKHYSSGMFVRLAFSLAVHTNPDVLLIDEVLSVGDERFQRKCLRKFTEFRRAGKTIIVVSHDLGMISGLCSNVLLMSGGEVVASGPVDGVIGRYLQMVGEGEGVGVLQRGDMTLMFNSGRGSLFRGGREVTKKLGLYTSMLISSGTSPGAGIWHDSTRAIWTCATSSGNRLLARGEFISVPLVQEWEIDFAEDGHLYWRVVLEVLETVRLERRQANVMLSEAYRQWASAATHGEFPEEFTSRDYHNWEVLASLPCDAMTTKGNVGLPALEFRSKSDRFLATVVNSNFFFSGRVLMFLDLGAQELPPGRYPYFEGELLQYAC